MFFRSIVYISQLVVVFPFLLFFLFYFICVVGTGSATLWSHVILQFAKFVQIIMVQKKFLIFFILSPQTLQHLLGATYHISPLLAARSQNQNFVCRTVWKQATNSKVVSDSRTNQLPFSCLCDLTKRSVLTLF